MPARLNDGDGVDPYRDWMILSPKEVNPYSNGSASFRSTRKRGAIKANVGTGSWGERRTLKYPSMNGSEGYLLGSIKKDGMNQI